MRSGNWAGSIIFKLCLGTMAVSKPTRWASRRRVSRCVTLRTSPPRPTSPIAMVFSPTGRSKRLDAIFADKTAIDEETVRLHSHVAQYREILALDEPIGRKLDFLTQELNRESNTIGSKCQDVAITRLVVELKSEIEKIREQIQNIE